LPRILRQRGFRPSPSRSCARCPGQRPIRRGTAGVACGCQRPVDQFLFHRTRLEPAKVPRDSLSQPIRLTRLPISCSTGCADPRRMKRAI
jgi:hypothetical protein